TRLLAAVRRPLRASALLGLHGAPGETGAEPAKRLAAEQEPEALVRAHALVALGSLNGGKGGAALAAWFDAAPGLAWRRLAVLSMAQADGDPASLALLKDLLEKALAAESAAWSMKAEDEAPAPAMPAGLQLLRPVLYALAARDDGTPGLLRALELKNLELREFALRAVAQRRPPQCAAAVLTALSGLERIDVPDLARLFEAVFGPEHAPMLRELLAKGNDAGRVAAASILAQRPDLAGDPATLQALVSACSDLSSLVRARAAKALGRARHAEALPDLTALLLDTDPETCANAAEAVARIGDREACARAVVASTRAFRRDIRWYRAFGIAAGETEAESLIKLTASDVWTDRYAGIAGLAACARPEALARLLEIYHDPDSPLRTLAFRALPEQGEAAVAGLAPDLQDPKPAVRAQALHVLGRLPSPASAKRLLQALDDEDPGVRAMADWGLRSLTGKDAGYDPAGEPAARAEASNRWRGLLPAALRAP
ncbi:MAG: HEAT repeat domain-containing protein, partial [Planctomycetota bacterium]|nr:HEAT repeat domain-containing protein [Planctomycetota bacterium]